MTDKFDPATHRFGMAYSKIYDGATMDYIYPHFNPDGDYEVSWIESSGEQEYLTTKDAMQYLERSPENDLVPRAQQTVTDEKRMAALGAFNHEQKIKKYVGHGGMSDEHRETIRAALSIPAVKEGWKLVPMEVTPKMQSAYFEVIDDVADRVNTDSLYGRYSANKDAYRAMISAAPESGE